MSRRTKADGREPAVPREPRVQVVYCGGCNPAIDRGALAAELPLDDPEVTAGAAVHLSGCPRACASDHWLVAGAPAELRGAGASPTPPPIVVVAGELVDGVPTPAAALGATVAKKLKE